MNTQEKYISHGSLFSGIGGFDLAAKWISWKNVFHCEINEFCTKILNYHFPNAEHYTDITKTDFTKWRGKIDVLSGGFSCMDGIHNKNIHVIKWAYLKDLTLNMED